MLILYAMPPGLGQTSLSPFCVKAALLLAASGVSWRRRDLLNPGRMPYGRLPVLDDGEGRMIAETDAIRAYLQQRTGTDFDRGLSPRERAGGRALSTLAETGLYEALVVERWSEKTLWPLTREAAFATVPRPVRKAVAAAVRGQVLRTMRRRDVGGLPQEARHDRVVRDAAAIRAWLEDRPYLFGDAPTSADFAVAPILSAILTGPVPTALTRSISDLDFDAYADRVLAPLEAGGGRQS